MRVQCLSMGGGAWTAALLACILLLVAPLSCTSFYFREYGVVKPDQPYLFVGELLELYCNLTKLELLEDSTYLYFTHNGVHIPTEFLQVLTTRSVRLRYPVQRPSDGGHYVCWLRQERSNNPRTIGSQEVLADYKPVRVTEVKCVVYNWVNMTCVWDLAVAYQHPEHISVSLVWTISGEQRDCPKGQITRESCTWTQQAEEVEDRFLPGHRYIMQVSITNTRRPLPQRSQTFHIETSSIVKPSPVVALRQLAKRGNSTCLCLEWDHSDTVHDKLAIVMYTSQWNPSQNMEKRVYFTRGPKEALICQLTPFTQYTVRVAVRPLPRGGGDNQGQDGFTSEWMYITERTQPSVPAVSPDLCIGCFSYLPSGQTNRRNAVIYWKHIPWSLRNSVIHRYEVRYMSTMGGASNRSTTYPNNSLLLQNLAADSAYSLTLVAVTSEDKVSAQFSQLTLLPSSDTPTGLESLMVETDFHLNESWTGLFDLQWTDTGHSSDSYLIFWCLGDLATLMCQHYENNQVHWHEVTSNVTHFTIDVSSSSGGQGRPSDYIVGVARQTRRDMEIASSGILWAQCFYRHNATPRFLPDNVQFSQDYQACSLRVTWNYRPCDNSASDVYISHFVVYYCVISDASNSRCKGLEHNRTVGGNARSVVLEGLQQGAYYKASMAAASPWGASMQRSQAIFSRVLQQPQEDEPRDLSVVGVVLAVLVVLVLVLITFCKLRRRFRKNEAKLTTSFNDLPSLPADNAKAFKQDRPLPQLPATTTGNPCVAYSSGAGSLVINDQQQRGAGSKHKSITSETSLLGHEEAGTEDDSRRRCKPGGSLRSEQCRLLPDTAAAPSNLATDTLPCRYDSDSGAESRYSSEDHDYAWVESSGSAGSAEEAATSMTEAQRAGKIPRRQGDLLAVTHRPAPDYAPPPLPADKADGLPVVASVRCGKDGVTMALDCPKAPTPRQLSLMSETFDASGVYAGSEEATLPRRLLGARLGGYVSYVPGQTILDPYASTNLAALAHPAPPSPAPPAAVGCSQMEAMTERAFLRGATQNLGSHDDTRLVANGASRHLEMQKVDGAVEGMYNPPWDCSGLAPLVASNRPLSLHTLRQLPQHFFDSSLRVNEGPTTEL